MGSPRDQRQPGEAMAFPELIHPVVIRGPIDLLTNGAHGCLERNFAVAAGLPCF